MHRNQGHSGMAQDLFNSKHGIEWKSIGNANNGQETAIVWLPAGHRPGAQFWCSDIISPRHYFPQNYFAWWGKTHILITDTVYSPRVMKGPTNKTPQKKRKEHVTLVTTCGLCQPHDCMQKFCVFTELCKTLQMTVKLRNVGQIMQLCCLV